MGKMKEKKAILELYENYIDYIYERTGPQNEIGTKILALEKELFADISQTKKEQIEQMSDLELQRHEALCKDIFVYGFSLATKLFTEGLSN